MLKIVGLAAEARSGKDTFCELLHEQLRLYSNFVVHIRGFAGPLKDGIGGQVFGLSDEQLYGDLKDVIDVRYDKTPGRLLQEAGEGMRQLFGDDVWVKSPFGPLEWAKRLGTHRVVLIPDVRYPNEGKAIKELGGVIIKLKNSRPGLSGDEGGRSKSHPSESQIDDVEHDILLHNEGSVDDLRFCVATVAGMLLQYWNGTKILNFQKTV